MSGGVASGALRDAAGVGAAFRRRSRRRYRAGGVAGDLADSVAGSVHAIDVANIDLKRRAGFADADQPPRRPRAGAPTPTPTAAGIIRWAGVTRPPITDGCSAGGPPQEPTEVRETAIRAPSRCASSTSEPLVEALRTPPRRRARAASTSTSCAAAAVDPLVAAIRIRQQRRSKAVFAPEPAASARHRQPEWHALGTGSGTFTRKSGS